mmetsp:Transcript_64625/g.135616  ORF Transcript_64625/g.135616 Transcript_64625/m.135616 type:complete len:210 (+) Transcript_64625:456-1085(+)
MVKIGPVLFSSGSKQPRWRSNGQGSAGVGDALPRHSGLAHGRRGRKTVVAWGKKRRVVDVGVVGGVVVGVLVRFARQRLLQLALRLRPMLKHRLALLLLGFLGGGFSSGEQRTLLVRFGCRGWALVELAGWKVGGGRYHLDELLPQFRTNSVTSQQLVAFFHMLWALEVNESIAQVGGFTFAGPADGKVDSSVGSLQANFIQQIHEVLL